MTRPLRVAIVGCGNVAVNFHLPAYQALPDRYEIVGLADPTPERLAVARELAGLPEERVHLEATGLLSRADVDLIDVCTPQHLHRGLVIAAARRASTSCVRSRSRPSPPTRPPWSTRRGGPARCWPSCTTTCSSPRSSPSAR